MTIDATIAGGTPEAGDRGAAKTLTVDQIAAAMAHTTTAAATVGFT